jgi:hypothetical protein
MRAICYLVLIVALLRTDISAAQDFNPRTLDALDAMSGTVVDTDLVPVAPKFEDLAGGLSLLRDALGIIDSSIGATPAGRAATTRLLHLAQMLDADADHRRSSTGASMDRMDVQDVAALAEATGGFPDARDGVRYLFARKPSLRESFSHVEYIVIRLSAEPPRQVMFEMTTTPYRDLGPAWSRRELAPGDDLVELPTGEHGETRRFNLAALPDVVLAAKAFRLAARSSEAQRPYFTYVASRALSHAEPSAQETIAESVLNTTINALRQSKVATNDPALQALANRLRFAVPPAAFFARDFAKAASSYRELSHGEPDQRLWAAWGEGMARFGARDFVGATAAFDRVASLLTNGSRGEGYAYMLDTLLTLMPASERSTLADNDNWHTAAVARLSAAKIDDAKAAAYDFDFAHLMTTIGRTDLGLMHMLHRLDAARYLKGEIREKLESGYLREVAAFARDLCYGVSFTMRGQGVWEIRSTNGYPAQLDFLHNVARDGLPAGPGQIVSLDDGRPYGMTAPEEDCVTVGTAYGIPTSSQEATSESAHEPNSSAAAAAVANWALGARNRISPAPSIAPYLKLVWVEWFRQAFEPLKASSIRAESFVYKALDLTKITTPVQVLALKELPATTGDQAALIDEFISLRSYLETNYRQQSSRQ